VVSARSLKAQGPGPGPNGPLGKTGLDFAVNSSSLVNFESGVLLGTFCVHRIICLIHFFFIRTQFIRISGWDFVKNKGHLKDMSSLRFEKNNNS